MDRETFDRILVEEGIDDAGLRDGIWRSRPSGVTSEENLRLAAKKYVQELLGLKVRKALNDAMAKEYGWDN